MKPEQCLKLMEDPSSHLPSLDGPGRTFFKLTYSEQIRTFFFAARLISCQLRLLLRATHCSFLARQRRQRRSAH